MTINYLETIKLCSLVLIACCPSLVQAQWMDNFDNPSVTNSIFTIESGTDFSITHGTGEMIFNGDNVSDPADTSFALWNFDNHWDQNTVITQNTFPRATGSLPEDRTRLEFCVTSQRATAWYIGFMPMGADKNADPKVKYGDTWHYFWLGAPNPFYTFVGGESWANATQGDTVGTDSSPDADTDVPLDGTPDGGCFAIELDEVMGALWQVWDPNTMDWVTHIDSLGNADLGGKAHSTETDFHVLINHDGGNDDLKIQSMSLRVGGGVPVEISEFLME